MVQEFLRRRLNPFLLISTVVVLAILAGLSVTYQDVLSDKVSTNQQLRQTVEEKNNRIATLENRTTNLSTSLAAARQDLAATVNQTQRQKTTISDLRDTVSSLNSTIQALRSTIEQKEATIASLEDTIDTKETTIANRENDLNTICDDYSSSNEINITGDREDTCERWD